MAGRTVMLRALRDRTSPWRSAPSPIARRGSFFRFVSTLVLAEHEAGFLKPSSLSAIEAAGTISKENSISVLLAGSGPSLQKAASHASSSHPLISQVLVADTDILLHPLAESWAELVKLVYQKGGYSYIISAASSFGKNILPRAAALLDVLPIADVIKIPEPRLFIRPIYAGNALCTVRYTGLDPCMLTIRSTSFSFSSEPRTDGAPISLVDLSSFNEAAFGKSRWLSHTSQDTEHPDLGNARVVVTGGRGLKSAENFKLLEKLAEKLGAAVGATRAAVDAGFVPNDLQVGQTGKIVAPELYLAFGVSGAIQHLAGMRDSKVIVAVNKDADAPIFQVADYGLVADLFQVIPELLEKLPEKK
uniref:Electron transfer flavoprotein subunit alpha n=1 Tax=Anthurium amnicola TaxID=1678845 RepID=A0A1D1YXX5_9ARAE